ncbi:uncharacterized protein LOC142572264 [Dermacentor variabilis]|uniref:uncharacterized protein LOC142572264 n=1 Tax=Dermacentor variabilis TaxID=34621 RepID=UPI003F5C97D5
MPGARLADLNSVITCVLCGGYLVNATTLVECLHSFCKVCIVQFLATSHLCPICDVPVHKTKPHQSIRLDKTLQDIVYKVVPGLYQKEMKKRRDFYEKHPENDTNVTCPEDRGIVDGSSRLIFSPDDTISLSLEYSTGKQEQAETSGEKGKGTSTDSGSETEVVPKRFLNCPAAFTISHLQKFIRMKYSLAPQYQVDILHMDDVLSHDFTLMDVAYIYVWKRDCPLRLSFRICKVPPKPSAVAVPSLNTTSEAEQTAANGAKDNQEKEIVKKPAENKPALLKPVEDSQVSMPPPRTPEQVNKLTTKSPSEPAGAVPSSVPQPEEPREPNTTIVPAAEPPIATVVPAAEHHALETPEMKTTAEEESTAPGSPKAIALVQSTSPQRQKASEPPAEAQSPPPLPKITISTLDKNSHKILIHTKEVPPTLGQALSPPHNGQDRSSPPSGKKSKRKEQRDVDRHHQSKRKSPEKVEKRVQWCRSPPEDGGPNKKLKLDGCDDAVEVDAVCRKSISSPLQRSEGGASLPEPAKHNMPKAVPSPRKPPPPPPAHPRTPPCTSLPPNLPRSDEDTRPLDLSVSHRGATAAIPQEPPRRPRGRPPLPLPSIMQPLPLVAKRPSPPPTTAYSPPTSTPLFHKLPAAQPSSSSSHHHHHHHHRGNSKSFLKGANLTCINPDPNAFHTKIVIKNVPPRNSTNNSLHRV